MEANNRQRACLNLSDIRLIIELLISNYHNLRFCLFRFSWWSNSLAVIMSQSVIVMHLLVLCVFLLPSVILVIDATSYHQGDLRPSDEGEQLPAAVAAAVYGPSTAVEPPRRPANFRNI